MSVTCAAAININQDFCSRCSICFSICPYEAITRDLKTDKVDINLQKCQVCGICYSACPVRAIEIVYYDYGNLLKYVKDLREKKKSNTLVLMCRGNSPATCEIEEILEKQGLDIKNYIPLRLPCSGRIPTDFILQVLKTGVKNIVSIQCEDNFCRFKEGSKINTRRLMLEQAMLEQLGYKDALKVIKYSQKAFYETEKCVGCDKCVFICPYNAIEAEEFATPKINSDLCVGCGACALVCPHLAIEVKGFEFENISALIKLCGKSAEKLRKETQLPIILVFCCQWAEFSILDDPESLLLNKKAVIIEIPCFKALDPTHIIEALYSGFDGVMAAVCAEEDCKLKEGRETAERNMTVLKKTLTELNLIERFDIFTLHPRCVGEFIQRLDTFYAKIKSMPPLKLRKMEAKVHV